MRRNAFYCPERLGEKTAERAYMCAKGTYLIDKFLLCEVAVTTAQFPTSFQYQKEKYLRLHNLKEEETAAALYYRANWQNI